MGGHPIVDIYNFDPEIEIRHKRIVWVTNCLKSEFDNSINRMNIQSNREFVMGAPRPTDSFDVNTLMSGSEPYVGIYEVNR